MEKRLIVRFVRMKNLLAAQVLEQPDGFRGIEIIRQNGVFIIASTTAPKLNENVLFIRGDDPTRDEDVAYYAYHTEKAAKEALKEFIRIIDELNKRELPDKDDSVETVTAGG